MNTKPHTIHVSSHDEVSDILRRIKNSSNPNIEVELPEGFNALYQRINLILLQRELSKLSNRVTVTFLSPDAPLVDLMRRYQIRVMSSYSTKQSRSDFQSNSPKYSEEDPFSHFFSQSKSLTNPANPPGEIPKNVSSSNFHQSFAPMSLGSRLSAVRNMRAVRSKLSAKWLLSFSIVGGVICAGIILSLPRATVTIQERGSQYSKDITLIFETQIDQVNIENRIVPLRRVDLTKSITQTLTPQIVVQNQSSITEEDLKLFKETTQQALQAKLNQELTTNADSTLTLLPVPYQISEPQYEGLPAVGAVGQSFSVQAVASITGLYYNTSDVETVIRSVLMNQIIDGKHLGNTLEIAFEDPQLGTNPTQLRVRAYVEYQAIEDLNPAFMQRSLSAKPISQARRFLEEFDSIQYSTIEVQPTFWPILPILPQRINLIISS